MVAPSVTDLARAGLAALLLGGCATAAPPLPPPDPSRLLARDAPPPARASVSAPWGAAPSLQGATRLNLAVDPPTVTERYWGWSLLADAAGLVIFSLDVTLIDDPGQRAGFAALAGAPSGIAHLAHGRPLAALAASGLRALTFAGGLAFIDSATRRTDIDGAVSGAFLGAILIGAGLGMGIALDVVALSRREVASPGWRRLPVLPSVAVTSNGVQAGVGGAF